MDNSFSCKDWGIDKLRLLLITIVDLYHALLFGCNALFAEYHFRKAHEASFAKRRRDEQRHGQAWAKHRAQAQAHHAQPPVFRYWHIASQWCGLGDQ